MIGLPDINVLLALAWSHHAHHEAAHAWFAREATSGWATCLLTQAGVVEHPNHHYAEMAPPLTATSFVALVPHLVGYRQVPDATLRYLAHVHGMKLITFDRAIEAICPWPDHLELLTP